MQAAFGTFDPASDPKAKGYFDSAKANFSKAIELDPRHAGAYEFRGMANEGVGDLIRPSPITRSSRRCNRGRGTGWPTRIATGDIST
jgi:hypothetical protein